MKIIGKIPSRYTVRVPRLGHRPTVPHLTRLFSIDVSPMVHMVLRWRRYGGCGGDGGFSLEEVDFKTSNSKGFSVFECSLKVGLKKSYLLKDQEKVSPTVPPLPLSNSLVSRVHTFSLWSRFPTLFIFLSTSDFEIRSSQFRTKWRLTRSRSASTRPLPHNTIYQLQRMFVAHR